MNVLSRKKTPEQDDYWSSMSDLMTGLMMVFLFISVSYMFHQRAAREEADTARDEADKARTQIRLIAEKYEKTKQDLYKALTIEFENDLDKWSAEIDKKTLSVRFGERESNEPQVLFDKGKAFVKPGFKTILEDFFPRYVEVITRPEFKDVIDEIRIEGHTSSVWEEAGTDEMDAYFKNMALSQERTRTVLGFVLILPDDTVSANQEWLKKKLTANGLSSSNPIEINHVENENLSQRVEFRVRTNADDRIGEILQVNGIVNETPGL